MLSNILILVVSLLSGVILISVVKIITNKDNNSISSRKYNSNFKQYQDKPYQKYITGERWEDYP